MATARLVVCVMGWTQPQMKYYFYHVLSWPQLLYVAEDFNKAIVGYGQTNTHRWLIDCQGMF